MDFLVGAKGIRSAKDLKGRVVGISALGTQIHFLTLRLLKAIGLEPDKPEDISDIERLLNPPAPRIVYNVGRNEPCPCGSGKKYKKCCGK